MSKIDIINIIANNTLEINDSSWNFDLRPILLSWNFSSSIAKIFWTHFNQYDNLQILCMEFSGIPIGMAILSEAEKQNKQCNMLVLRKEKQSKTNKSLVEGYPKEKILTIFIDDILNSGKSLNNAKKIINSEFPNITLNHSFFIIDFLRTDNHIQQNEINTYSISTLKDFNLYPFKFSD